MGGIVCTEAFLDRDLRRRWAGIKAAQNSHSHAPDTGARRTRLSAPAIKTKKRILDGACGNSISVIRSLNGGGDDMWIRKRGNAAGGWHKCTH